MFVLEMLVGAGVIGLILLLCFGVGHVTGEHDDNFLKPFLGAWVILAVGGGIFALVLLTQALGSGILGLF